MYVCEREREKRKRVVERTEVNIIHKAAQSINLYNNSNLRYLADGKRVSILCASVGKDSKTVWLFLYVQSLVSYVHKFYMFVEC